MVDPTDEAGTLDGSLDLGADSLELDAGLPDLEAGTPGLELDAGLPDLGAESLEMNAGSPGLELDADGLGNEAIGELPADLGSEATLDVEVPAAGDALNMQPEASIAQPTAQAQPKSDYNPNIVNIKNIQSIKVRVEAILGGVNMSVSELAEVKQNDLIPLDACVGDEVDLWANGVLIGRGEIVVLEEEVPRFGITLTKLVNTNSSQAAE